MYLGPLKVGDTVTGTVVELWRQSVRDADEPWPMTETTYSALAIRLADGREVPLFATECLKENWLDRAPNVGDVVEVRLGIRWGEDEDGGSDLDVIGFAS